MKRPTKKNGRWLLNRLQKAQAIEKLKSEDFARTTVSFYRYVKLGSLKEVYNLRDQLFLDWEDLGCLGRIYLAQEGINAQMSVPDHHWDSFVEYLEGTKGFKNMPLKRGLDQSTSFWKLKIKVKDQIVADGLSMQDYDIENVGQHLNAEIFNEAMEHKDTIVVDMRNAYESDIGYFKGAITPKVETFREELPYVAESLKEQKNKKLLLYCTGGIRCEKASAYLKSKGFKDVNQLHGGIISYKHEIQEKGLENKFRGANYVFDERSREAVSDEIIGVCYTCDSPCDLHINCANIICNKLFLQCEECKKKMNSCCNKMCSEKILT